MLSAADVKERELNNMLRFMPGYQVGLMSCGRHAAPHSLFAAPLATSPHLGHRCIALPSFSHALHRHLR